MDRSAAARFCGTSCFRCASARTLCGKNACLTSNCAENAVSRGSQRLKPFMQRSFETPDLGKRIVVESRAWIGEAITAHFSQKRAFISKSLPNSDVRSLPNAEVDARMRADGHSHASRRAFAREPAGLHTQASVRSRGPAGPCTQASGPSPAPKTAKRPNGPL